MINKSINDELKRYMANVFVHSPGIIGRLPLPAEEFVAPWRSYLDESLKSGVFRALKNHLPQLNFPIEKGISSTERYRAAINAEMRPCDIVSDSSLPLEAPDELELIIHETPAGPIPVLITRNRNDFVALFRALAFKNEPADIPASTGACAISGYNNCERYIAYKNMRALEDPFGLAAPEEPAVQKSHYQDRFLLLSDGPYSGISSVEAGFEEAQWRNYSLKIRLGHESAHYFTKRCLGSMRNNAHDELIADYAGICEALGAYDSSLFLKFCGIKGLRKINPAGRINNYKGTPPLSDENFAALCELLRSAALNVEVFDKKCRKTFSGGDFAAAAILCMASLAIDEMAAPDGAVKLEKTLEAIYLAR
jgi:hypothetical protein